MQRIECESPPTHPQSNINRNQAAQHIGSNVQDSEGGITLTPKLPGFAAKGREGAESTAKATDEEPNESTELKKE